MDWQYNDGGRLEAGYKGNADDCVTRAIAIITEKPYQEVYDLVNKYGASERKSTKNKSNSSARTGVYKNTTRKIMEHYGFKWIPIMKIGSGTTVHLKADELPTGKLITKVSKHICAVIDGVIYDTHNPSRYGTRAVYGYWVMEGE
jgi:hypothetical protein